MAVVASGSENGLHVGRALRALPALPADQRVWRAVPALRRIVILCGSAQPCQGSVARTRSRSFSLYRPFHSLGDSRQVVGVDRGLGIAAGPVFAAGAVPVGRAQAAE